MVIKDESLGTEVVPHSDSCDLESESTEENLLEEKGRQKILSPRVPFKNGRPAPIDGKSELLSFAMMLETCKTAEVNGALRTVRNAAAGQGFSDTDTNLAVALSQMAELGPQSPLEAMLISQMIAVNTAAGQVMDRAMGRDQRLEGWERNINLATKLQRTFLQQVDALQKLRGKGQQKVIVEHVNVHQGGQAIVGNVGQSVGRGGGEK